VWPGVKNRKRKCLERQHGAVDAAFIAAEMANGSTKAQQIAMERVRAVAWVSRSPRVQVRQRSKCRDRRGVGQQASDGDVRHSLKLPSGKIRPAFADGRD
jgi:hypothetical protein